MPALIRQASSAASPERAGAISICVDGDLMRDLEEDKFRELLGDIFLFEDKADEARTEKTLDGEDRLAASGDRDLVPD